MSKSAVTKSHRTEWLFYKNKLTKKEAEGFDLILDGFMRYESNIPYRNLDVKQIEKIYEFLKLEIPQLFFVERITCQHMPVLKCGVVIPKYRMSKENAFATLDALKVKVEQIKQNMTCINEYEKEKYIHDYLCKHVKYDYSFRDSSFECVGPLLFGKGVCEGISKATKLLLAACGIDSLIVHGRSNNQQVQIANNDSHAWNIVRISNSFYHLDVTFDMTIMVFDVVRYDYMNLSDSDIMLDHSFVQSDYPCCSSSRDYYIENNMYMENRTSFKSYMGKLLSNRENDIVIKLPYVADINKARDGIISILQECINEKRIMMEYQIAYNETQRVFHLHAN